MTLRFRVQGRVQGVGFRAHVQRSARALGLVGEVWNTRDGEVECIATGSPEALTALRRLLGEGPGRVDAVHPEPSPLEFSGETFSIGPTR